MTERCDCCDLPADMCGQAAARAAADQRRALRSRALAEPGTIPARHAGRCPICEERYGVGEPIRKGVEGWTPVLCCLDLGA